MENLIEKHRNDEFGPSHVFREEIELGFFHAERISPRVNSWAQMQYHIASDLSFLFCFVVAGAPKNIGRR